jgi:hypothetical protein
MDSHKNIKNHLGDRRGDFYPMAVLFLSIPGG